MLKANSLALLHILYHLKVYPIRINDNNHSTAILKLLNEHGNRILKQDEYNFLTKFLENCDSHIVDVDFTKIGKLVQKTPTDAQQTLYNICEKLGYNGFKSTIVNSGLATHLGAKNFNFQNLQNNIIELPLNS